MNFIGVNCMELNNFANLYVFNMGSVPESVGDDYWEHGELSTGNSYKNLVFRRVINCMNFRENNKASKLIFS